jgi:hypothetical protein
MKAMDDPEAQMFLVGEVPIEISHREGLLLLPGNSDLHQFIENTKRIRSL